MHGGYLLRVSMWPWDLAIVGIPFTDAATCTRDRLACAVDHAACEAAGGGDAGLNGFGDPIVTVGGHRSCSKFFFFCGGNGNGNGNRCLRNFVGGEVLVFCEYCAEVPKKYIQGSSRELVEG